MTALFVALSLQYGLPPKLLSSLCYVESKHRYDAIHKDDGSEDSLGICQMHLSTAKQMGFKGSKKELMDPATNMTYAALYLKYQIKRYHSTKRGVIAYNRGNAKHLTASNYQIKVFKEWRRECLK